MVALGIRALESAVAGSGRRQSGASTRFVFDAESESVKHAEQAIERHHHDVAAARLHPARPPDAQDGEHPARIASPRPRGPARGRHRSP